MTTRLASERILTGFKGERSGYYFDIRKRLFDKKTSFQHIQIFDAHGFGRIMLLDNEIMTTEWDGFVYPEMIMHPALTAHPNPKTVGIIGGGDGGSVTEACKHPDVEQVILCEIDEEVINAAREYLPELAKGLGDARAKCVFEEGSTWLEKQKGCFDMIAVDGTDPVGPGVCLFEEKFYRRAQAALKPGGICVQQVESPFYSLRPDGMTFELSFEEIIQRARSVFKNVRVYCATIPTYLGAYWAFLYASDGELPMTPRPERWDAIKGQTRYYTPDVHQAAFVLPPFVQELVAAK